ncbi:hypothetical protein [Methylomonas fluvii]|nr:hypothetical protein [Methylomonas fluvii]
MACCLCLSNFSVLAEIFAYGMLVALSVYKINAKPVQET